MAKRPPVDRRCFTVAVVGLSGAEREKGVVGSGKSCLCNRFMRPHADEYFTDHISVLSQSDFGGRVVNNDHFLYWGRVQLTSDDGVDTSFQVVEQTEFIDDSTFQPFKSGKTEPYHRRATAVKLQSAEKLVYICKNQLGLEHEFNEHYMPDGRLTIDGFLVVYDVSHVTSRNQDHQFEFTTLLLQQCLKTKRPVVLTTTKNDAASDAVTRDLERLMQRKEFKNSVQVVETSALEGVNVEGAFFTLAHLIDRTRGKFKVVTYVEAARARREVREVAAQAYMHLLRTRVTDYKAQWTASSRKLLDLPDFIHYKELFGSDEAKKQFRKHVGSLRAQFIEAKQEAHLEKLRQVLEEILPDINIIADRSWPNILRWLRKQDYFERHFIEVPDGVHWFDGDVLESPDDRIPWDLLDGQLAEAIYRNHVNRLRSIHRRQELCKSFKHLLEDNCNVTPGKLLHEVSIFFLGRECFSALSDDDKNMVYDTHQAELREAAKEDFLELLLENSDVFSKFFLGRESEEELREVHEQLQHEPRYHALARMQDERAAILHSHVTFSRCPSKERCPFRQNCVETVVEAALATKARRPESWSRNSQFLLNSDDNKLNLVLLGSHGLADSLAQDIRAQCEDDEYVVDGQVYSLDYRLIDGDVSLPMNSFKTADFLPHGCFCVFNSRSTLNFVRESLQKTIMGDVTSHEYRLPFQGLPVTLVLGHDPAASEEELQSLRDETNALAERLQCPFVDVPSAMMVSSQRLFHRDQIELAVHSLVNCIRHRSSFVNPWHMAESLEPDLRILMVLMCGDKFSCELPLSPLLNHQCCYVTSDKYPTLTLETFLDDNKRKVEVTIVSYHGAIVIRRDELYHGYILVYSSKRRASLANLSTFSTLIPPSKAPLKILCVTEGGSTTNFFSSDVTQSLMSEGNALADRLHASFSTTSVNFKHQTSSYTPFFQEAWDRKTDTEMGFGFSDTPERPEHPTRPLLPRFHGRADFPAAMSKSSTSQSTESMEHHGLRTTDESSRASSSSPPPCDAHHHEALYAEIPLEHVVKPSQVRRSLYADLHMAAAPSASTSESSSFSREGSTDTDCAPRSPRATARLVRSARVESLRLRETGARGGHAQHFSSRRQLQQHSGWAVHDDRFVSDDNGGAGLSTFRLGKSSTLPVASICDDLHGLKVNGSNTKPPTAPKPVAGPKRLDAQRFAGVKQVLDRNLTLPTDAPHRLARAPLAKPEAAEELADYAQVRDAILNEEDYASVHDALPAGKLHKVKSANRTDNGSVSDGSEGTADELKDSSKSTKKRRSFRSKKKSKTLEKCTPVISPPMSDSDFGASPQSIRAHISTEEPTAQRRKSPSPARHLDTSDEVEEGSTKWSWRMLSADRDSSSDKARKKQEKKAREEERRRRKEEERRAKAMTKKVKRKEGQGRATPQSSFTGTLSALEDQAQADDHLVPLFVEKSVAFIEKEGVGNEGIYRVPGSKLHVEMLVQSFREDCDIDFEAMDVPVNAVATSLKLFFSELSEPLFPRLLHDGLLEAGSKQDDDERKMAVKSVLSKLAAPYEAVLAFLMAHLRRMSKHEDKTSMNAANLAICWWPTLMQPEIESFERMALVSKPMEEVIVSLIENHEFYFPSFE